MDASDWVEEEGRQDLTWTGNDPQDLFVAIVRFLLGWTLQQVQQGCASLNVDGPPPSEVTVVPAELVGCHLMVQLHSHHVPLVPLGQE